MAKKAGYKFPAVPLNQSLWDLKIFSKDIFLRHPACELHQNRLGLLDRLMLYFGIKKRSDWCEGKPIL